MCDMKKHTAIKTKTVRRSVALPRRLLEDVSRLADPGAARNWNRLIVTALEEYAARQKRARLEDAMEAMAADPAIQSEVRSIGKLFGKTERDGLA